MVSAFADFFPVYPYPLGFPIVSAQELDPSQEATFSSQSEPGEYVLILYIQFPGFIGQFPDERYYFSGFHIRVAGSVISNG